MLRFLCKLKNRKGFTLIELIVVVAILGILVTIAVPRIAGIRNDAVTSADAANQKVVENAVQMYYAKEGAYPTSTTEMDSLVDDYLNGTAPTPNSGSFYMDTDGSIDTTDDTGDLKVD